MTKRTKSELKGKVLAVLTNGRRGYTVTKWNVARELFARPNHRTNDNVGQALDALTDEGALVATETRDGYRVYELRESIELTRKAALILGLDDGLRFEGTTRVWPRGAEWIWLFGPADQVQNVVNEIYDRATEGADGYGHTAGEKATLRAALRRLAGEGWLPDARS